MEEFYIDSDGTRLHAKLDRVGTKKGPLCILIHGFTGHMEEDHIIAAKDAINAEGLLWSIFGGTVLISVKEGRGDSLLPQMVVTNKKPLNSIGDEPSREKQQCV